MATITKPMALDESFNTTESTSRNQADVLVGIEQAIVRGFGQVANAVSYDNTDSGLTADNVQDAIDEVDDTVDGLVDDVAEISSSIESTQTVSGNPLTLTDCAPINAESLVVELEPKQEGSGDPSPTNVRPITGYTECEVDDVGKNLWGGIKFAQDIKDKKSDSVLDTADKTIEPSGFEPYVQLYSNFKANTQYTFILRASTAASSKGTNLRVAYTDNTFNDLFLDATANGKLVYVSTSGKTISYIGTVGQDTPPKLLYDECGLFEGVITLDEFVPYYSTSATIQFGQTVYGGKSNFTDGGTSDEFENVDLGDLSWTYRGDGLFSADLSDYAFESDVMAYCSGYRYIGTVDGASMATSNGSVYLYYNDGQSSRVIYVVDTQYADAIVFKAAVTGIQFVYEKATPTTIATPPTDLKMLKGTNNITTNGTTINLGYQQDNVVGEVKGEIEKCAVDAEFMQFTDGTDTFTDVNLSLDALSHTVSVVGSKIEQKRFICFEVMDKMGGVLQGILASCIAFTDGAKTPSGTAFRAYIESLQMYVNFRIYGSGGSYTLAYQSESSFSASAFYVRVRMMNNL